MFTQCLKVPFPEAINTFGLSDGFLYSVSLTGFYRAIPSLAETFDGYITGGGSFTQLFFSGSGGWLSSGFSFTQRFYLAETFDNYQTGLISGYGVRAGNITGLIPNATGLTSGILISGYTFLNKPTGYTVWSGYL